MAVIHISEAEATKSIDELMAKVREGNEVRIVPRKKTLSEAIRLAELRNSSVTLDDRFGEDLDIVISNHEHEGLRDPWVE